MVSDLLVGQLWNWDLISKVFEYKDTKEIIKTITSHNNSNQVNWGYLNLDNFLVKSTYKFIIDFQNANRHRKMWTRLCNLNIHQRYNCATMI